MDHPDGSFAGLFRTNSGEMDDNPRAPGHRSGSTNRPVSRDLLMERAYRPGTKVEIYPQSTGSEIDKTEQDRFWGETGVITDVHIDATGQLPGADTMDSVSYTINLDSDKAPPPFLHTDVQPIDT